jgi:hypothetical protein
MKAFSCIAFVFLFFGLMIVKPNSVSAENPGCVSSGVIVNWIFYQIDLLSGGQVWFIDAPNPTNPTVYQNCLQEFWTFTVRFFFFA